MRDTLFFYVLNVNIIHMGNIAAPGCTNPLCIEKMIRAYVRIEGKFTPDHWVCPRCGHVTGMTIRKKEV